MLTLVSIIICTADRPNSLEKTLESLNQITYNNCELIIVDASATQDTIELISIFSRQAKFAIKFIKVNQRNISFSRNTGIKLAAGSIIAFIDDDAIPPPEWLDQLLLSYSLHGEKCAGVGGTVRDMTRSNFPLQYKRGISNVISETIPIRKETASNYNEPQGFWYNCLMGANSSYRKDLLEQINGYDEFFEYFLDETDVCLRLIQLGYEIHYSNVIVDHYPQPSHNREDQKHLTCWYELGKNTTYFALKHGFKKICFPILVLRLFSLLIRRCLLRIIRLKFTHNLSTYLILKYIKECIKGVRVGWVAGRQLYKNNCSRES